MGNVKLRRARARRRVVSSPWRSVYFPIHASQRVLTDQFVRLFSFFLPHWDLIHEINRENNDARRSSENKICINFFFIFIDSVIIIMCTSLRSSAILLNEVDTVRIYLICLFIYDPLLLKVSDYYSLYLLNSVYTDHM